MTVFVIGRVTVIGMRGLEWQQPPYDQYEVTAEFLVGDGETMLPFGTNVRIFVPLSFNARRADRCIREGIAAEVLRQSSLTIDPEDIYIPLSS